MATTEDGIFIDDDFRFVTVVDRIGVGGDVKLAGGFVLPGVLYWDHKPHPILPEFQLRGPAAKHFFRYGSQAYVHTKDHEYVCRLGLKGGDEDLIREIGREFLDPEPIDVDLETVEGWDTAAIDPSDRKKTKTLKRGPRESVAALRARMGESPAEG